MNRNARATSGVLERIAATKRAEVAALRGAVETLRGRAEAAGPVPDFRAALEAGECVAVIAEVKRRSPSAGVLGEGDAAADRAVVYEAAGAAAVSVLTDRAYFGGELADLESVAGAVSVPVLRKDFILDAVQVYEARGSGAAAVLLIARLLEDAVLRDLRELGESLGLASLVEVHDERELERAQASGATIVGINNRDLDTFETDLSCTERLGPDVARGVLLVSESGVRTAADVARLAAAGASAVLVGEALMRSRAPGALVRSLAAVRREG